MAAVASNLPQKRRLEDDFRQRPVSSSRVVIELSSESESESETDTPTHPSKRHKSLTPSENNNQPSSSLRFSTPLPPQPIPRRSPFKKVSPYSGLDKEGVVDLQTPSPSPQRSQHTSLPNRSSRPPQYSISSAQEKLVQAKARLTASGSNAQSREPIGSQAFSLEVPKSTLANPRRHQPYFSHVEVTSPQSSQALLRQFQRSDAEWRAEHDQVWKSLKRSADLAKRKPGLVQKHFGQTGFSSDYTDPDKDEEVFLREAASKKAKKVNRNETDIETLIKSTQHLNLEHDLIHPRKIAQTILTSRFEEQISPPLAFKNRVDRKRIHGKFQFINSYILGEKVRAAPPSTNRGCGCKSCNLSSCLCLTKKVPDEIQEDVLHIHGKSEGQQKPPKSTYHDEQVQTYTRHPNGTIVLCDAYIAHELDPSSAKQEITECTDACGCDRSCWNRVVGNGRTLPLEIIKTEKCGFGVRSSKNIVKGQFIEKYLGEVVTETEIERREAAENEDDPSYVLSLDWFGTTNNNMTYHVDGKYFGSAMRFVNHSCNPNAKPFTVQNHKEDKRVYDIAFFAIKDIPAGTEIRIDYQPALATQEDVKEEAEATDGNADDLVPCHCGEKNCRLNLWQPGVKSRKRRRRNE